MSISPIAAANAYAVQAKEIAEAAKSATGAASGAGAAGEFGKLLGETVNSVIDTGQAADSQMTLQATGGGNVIDVVTAVAEAELTVQTIVSVRDRVLGAYQEIMRMPI